MCKNIPCDEYVCPAPLPPEMILNEFFLARGFENGILTEKNKSVFLHILSVFSAILSLIFVFMPYAHYQVFMLLRIDVLLENHYFIKFQVPFLARPSNAIQDDAVL